VPDYCAPEVRVRKDGSLHHVQDGPAEPGRPGPSLWDQVTSFDALHAAYRRARKEKRYQPDVLHFSANLESELIQLHHELRFRVYRTSRYRSFEVRDPKPRQILAPAFRDRVVHHALCAVIEPRCERRFIYDSYACRVGKGTHAAQRRLQAFLRRATSGGHRAWAVKADVSRYFPSIPHSLLRDRIHDVVGDPDIHWLIDEILASTALSEGAPARGLPIGALTSQLFANLYLDGVDHLVKEGWREPWYVRYMDDLVIVMRDQVQARARLADLQEAFHAIGLAMNPKSCLYPVAQGVPFVGFRIWPSHTRVLQGSLRRMRRRLRGMQGDYADGRLPFTHILTRIRSWLAHADHAQSAHVRARLLHDVIFHPRPSRAIRSAQAEPCVGDQTHAHVLPHAHRCEARRAGLCGRPCVAHTRLDGAALA
jgi:RNA-directed DNA polymerase